MVIARGIRIRWNYMKSLIPRGPPGKIYTNFPGRKPPRVRTYDFRQCKYVHVVMAVPLFKSLLDDFVVTTILPSLLGQTCQAADKMEVLFKLRRSGVDVQSHMSFIYMLRAFFWKYDVAVFKSHSHLEVFMIRESQDPLKYPGGILCMPYKQVPTLSF